MYKTTKLGRAHILLGTFWEHRGNGPGLSTKCSSKRNVLKDPHKKNVKKAKKKKTISMKKMKITNDGTTENK